MVESAGSTGLSKLFRRASLAGFVYGIALLMLIDLVGTLGYMAIGGPSVSRDFSWFLHDLHHHCQHRLC